MVEFHKQKEIEQNPCYLEEFIIEKNRPDFMNLLMPLKNGPCWNEVVKMCNFSVLHMAVACNAIEIVKVLLKHHEETKLDIYINQSLSILEGGGEENILEMAKRLKRLELTKIIQDVYEGKIKAKDLKPNLKKQTKN